MTPMEVALLLALAALVYQEVTWRDKLRRMEADYEKRLSAEVAMTYEANAAEGSERIRAFTFRAEKQEPRGLFGEVTHHLFLAVTMDGDTVKYASGDLGDIDRFHIPPELKRAILRFLSTEKRMSGAMGVPEPSLR